jgi:hypothetical protein
MFKKGENINEKTKEFIKNKKTVVLHNPTQTELKEFFDEGFAPKSMKFANAENVTIILKRKE